MMKISSAKRLKLTIPGIACALVLFSGIVILTVNAGYAQTLRLMEVKLQFKKIVQAGNTQIIRLFVRDQATGAAISGGNARFTVTYPTGTPVRQFNLLTDASGTATLSLPIDKNAELGSYALDTTVVNTAGYQDATIGTVNFAVMSHATSASLQDYSGHLHSSAIQGHNHHQHHHPQHH